MARRSSFWYCVSKSLPFDLERATPLVVVARRLRPALAAVGIPAAADPPCRPHSRGGESRDG